LVPSKLNNLWLHYDYGISSKFPPNDMGKNAYFIVFFFCLVRAEITRSG